MLRYCQGMIDFDQDTHDAFNLGVPAPTGLPASFAIF
jgi:hypothetical protein